MKKERTKLKVTIDIVVKDKDGKVKSNLRLEGKNGNNSGRLKGRSWSHIK